MYHIVIAIIRVIFMVFNTTFNNSSVISRQSVLLVEESGENNLLEFTDKLDHILVSRVHHNNLVYDVKPYLQ